MDSIRSIGWNPPLIEYLKRIGLYLTFFVSPLIERFYIVLGNLPSMYACVFAYSQQFIILDF